MERPIVAAVAGIAGIGATAYLVTHPEGALQDGRVIWAPLLGTASVLVVVSAALGHSYALECRTAKRRGAEQAELVRHKEAQAKARTEAGTLWKRAATAARADDCATVRELDPRIRELDVEFHAVVFARDVAIARCLATRE
jgi:hypothetical protein